MAGIWVFAETREQTLELLNAGMSLAKDLGEKLVSFAWSDELAREYISHGADEVLLLQPLAQDQPLESYVPVLAQTAREEAPDVFLVGASQRGKEIGARVAAQLNTGLCSNCIGFDLDKEKKLLQMERLLFGGLAVQKVICTTRPQMATVTLRTFDQAPLVEGKEGKNPPSCGHAVFGGHGHKSDCQSAGSRGYYGSKDRRLRWPRFREERRCQVGSRSGGCAGGRGGLLQAYCRRIALASRGCVPGHFRKED